MSLSHVRLCRTFGALVLTGALGMGIAHAQYVGPNDAGMAANVSAVLDKPVDDQAVSFQGHLLRKLGHERYVFSDGTGEITVEIDDDDFPRQPVDDKTRVEIVGEVDTGRNRAPEIEVKSLRVLQ